MALVSDATLLRAKLLPPALGPGQLVRERLHRVLAEGLERRRITVVSAPPGYGKSALVARFLGDRQHEVVWLRLDGTDRDPSLLCRYLVAGLRRIAPDFGEHSEGLVEELRARPAEIEQLADVLIRDAEALPDRVHVVLDRVEFLESATLCVRMLRRLVDYLPDTLHLMLLGRSYPEVGVHPRIARGEALILSADDLAFTAEETRQLLGEVFGLRLEPQRIDEIQRGTRGWVTALQLLRQTAQVRRGVELPADVFRRAEREIFDYFGEEVYSAEPEAVRRFLVSTALPSVLDADLVGDVLEQPDAAALLREVHRRGLFLTLLAGPRELYSYDPLFREFLARKLRAELGAGEERRLHRAYGRGYLERREPVAALGHLIEAADVEATVTVLERGRELLGGGFHDEVIAAATFLLESGAGTAIAHDLLGEARRLAGDYGAAVGHFARALSPPGAGPGLEREARAAALQGLAYSKLKLGRHEEALAAAEAALEGAAGNPALLARILNTLAILRYLHGDLAEAIAVWGRALASARQGEDEHLTLMVAHNLGLPHAVRGDLARASECFRMLTSGDNRRLGPEEAAAHLNLARIALLSGRFEQAAARLDDAREIARRLNLRALAGDVLEAEGSLLRELGRLDDAAAKYGEARAVFTALGLQEVLDNLAEEEALLTAQRGEVERAQQLVQDLVERARQAQAADRLGSALLGQGQILLLAGRHADAARALEEAVSIFARTDRAYQECTARMGLAASCLRQKRAETASREIAAAVRLATRYGYGATLLKLTARDAGLRAAVEALPEGRALIAPEETAPPRVGEDSGPDRPDLTIRLLGPFEVYRDAEHPIPATAWKLKKACLLFCYIAASRGRRATKDRLIDAVWGDARPSVVRKNFHPAISLLRGALNHGRHVPKTFVTYEAGSYRLNPSYSYALDTEAFDKAIATARRRTAAERAAAAADYERALALYRGPFLEGFDDSWIDPLRFHYQSLYEAALAEVADLELEAGRADAAVERLTRLVGVTPLDEGASVRLMRALGAAGRRGDVEREYRRLVRALAESLAVEPAAGTRRAYLAAVGGPGGR